MSYIYDYFYDILLISHNLIIILISYKKKNNLYGYGRKWWMPEWYLAYSDGIYTGGKLYVITFRGTLGLQSWFQVYGNYYKKLYQFSICFR